MNDSFLQAVFHEPPRRMLLRLPHSSVCVSDYLFPGETPYDSADSVLEILGFRPNIEFMDDEVELVAAPRPQPKVSEIKGRRTYADSARSMIICIRGRKQGTKTIL